MGKSLKMMICCFLSFALMFTSVEWSGISDFCRKVYGADTGNVGQKTALEAESTKNSTTFRLPDGKKKTVFYSQDVRFENEEGKLEDYDPSLIKIQDSKSKQGKDLSGYQYENKAGDKKHYFPEELTQETPVLMENGKYEISFAPIYGKQTKTNNQAETVEQSLRAAEDAVEGVSVETSKQWM